jgi:hypothetical protein
MKERNKEDYILKMKEIVIDVLLFFLAYLILLGSTVFLFKLSKDTAWILVTLPLSVLVFVSPFIVIKAGYYRMIGRWLMEGGSRVEK